MANEIVHRRTPPPFVPEAAVIVDSPAGGRSHSDLVRGVFEAFAGGFPMEFAPLRECTMEGLAEALASVRGRERKLLSLSLAWREPCPAAEALASEYGMVVCAHAVWSPRPSSEPWAWSVSRRRCEASDVFVGMGEGPFMGLRGNSAAAPLYAALWASGGGVPPASVPSPAASAQPPPRWCRSCHAMIPEGAGRCPDCGRRAGT